MEPGTHTRRRKDGSVDVEYYENIARCERTAALRRAMRALFTALGRLLRRIPMLFSGLRRARLRSQRA